MLPINYQYEVSAWIYHTLHFGDAAFAEWLHNKGYNTGNRSFKLFTFSNLMAQRFKVMQDRLRILSDQATLYLTFRIDEAMQHFVQGLFQQQRLRIGDRKSQADFEVSRIEMLPEPEFSTKMTFRCLSPMCVSKPVERNGKLQSWYLAPDHPEYAERLFENLLMRYQAVSPNTEKPDTDSLKHTSFTLKSSARSRLIKIKADTPQETRIRGYLFDFECQAPAELLKFGYEAGFGEKGSLGFGCVALDENN